MDQNQLLELAVEALNRQKAAVDAEIEAIRTELRGAGTTRTARSVAAGVVRKRRMPPAARKAQSDRMKKIWAARRRQAAKKEIPSKLKSERATVNKAISVAMKAAWARRKAKAGKTENTKQTPSKVPEKSAKA
jgi:hypothetical protein